MELKKLCRSIIDLANRVRWADYERIANNYGQVWELVWLVEYDLAIPTEASRDRLQRLHKAFEDSLQTMLK